MKTFKNYVKGFNTIVLILIISTVSIGIQSCKSDKKQNNKEHLKLEKDNNISIVTEAMDFQTQDTIPSGWNTFAWSNNSLETHLFLLDKYPEGKDVSDALILAADIQKGMDLIYEGKNEEANIEFGKLPEWFGKIVFSGGSGLLSPHESSITTLHLKPGYYVMDCYVKMANGVFHTVMGMVKGIIVLEEDSGNSPPEATVNIAVSSTEGISFDKSIKGGEQTFSVTFKDQVVHENFLGHDINLVQLDENADLKELEDWVNWITPNGLRTPSPRGITFLGGVNDSPAGSIGYFKVNLKPGKYVLISEVPNASSKNMLKTFVISN